MAKILLKGLKEYFEADDQEARIAASLKNDPTKWKESVKLGNHPCVMVCEIKDIYIEDVRETKDDGVGDSLKEYYKNRKEFLTAPIKDKVKWAFSQFELFWLIMNNDSLDKREDKEEIYKWYEKWATEWFSKNMNRTVISLKVMHENYLSKYEFQPIVKKKDNGFMDPKGAFRMWAIRTLEQATKTDKFA